MVTTRMIPIETLSGLELHTGDTLQILAVEEGSFLVRVSREEESPTRGSAGEWLKSARGAVRLADGETSDDVRIDYYTEKFGLTR